MALYQSSVTGTSPERMCIETLADIERVLGDDVDLLCLPELWATGPLSEDRLDYVEYTPEILFKLKALSDKSDMAISCGLPEKDGRGEKILYYNSAYFISRGREPLVYRKVHLFPPFGEERLFARGLGPAPVWHYFKGHELGIGPIICYDLRFPELSRDYCLQGCSIIICHALWPRERIGHFRTLLKARAMENQCFVVGVNAVGESRGVVFGGGSSVIAPDGSTLLDAGEEKGIFQCELDLHMMAVVRDRFFTAVPRVWQGCASTKVLSLEAVRQVVKRRQQAGQRCVFTNGCFDLLHAGHVAYLEEARSHGDFLVVGVNSDESVRSIKGPLRPINSEASRASVLVGLESVDYVVMFHEPTPLHIIESLEPDCLVKGADWSEDEIVGADLVKARGGQVVRIPFVHDVSTTRIIGKIIKSHKQ